MKTKIFAMAIAALALAACDKNNDDFTVDNLKDTPLTIASAGVAELTTRAIINGQLEGTMEADATLSVFVTDGSDDKYNADNVKWKHDVKEWSTTTPTLYEGANSNQKICALSPYVENASADGVTITADGVTDYLVASTSAVISNEVSLDMSHALTKLVLVPTLGTEVADDEIAKVEVQNMYVSGTLNIKENSWSNQGGATATLSMNKVNGNYEVLVIPMPSCQSFPMVITMSSGRVFKATISLDNVESKLAGGTQYTITLQVGQDTVAIGGITADSWGTPVEGGDLETE